MCVCVCVCVCVCGMRLGPALGSARSEGIGAPALIDPVAGQLFVVSSSQHGVISFLFGSEEKERERERERE